MDNQNKPPKVIETASATTSDDNKNSGPFAYIITAVALAFLIVIALAGAGCMSFVITAAVSESSTGSNGGGTVYDPHGNMDTNNMDWQEDWEEFLKEYEQEYGTGTGGSTTSDPTDQDKKTGSASVGEVLEFSIAPYGSIIDDELSASSYASVPAEVRTFARSVESTDKDYTNKLQALLDAATHDESQRSAKIKEAVDLCGEAKKAMEKIEVPAVTKDDEGAVKDALGTAKTEAAHRWELMGAEIGILNTNEDVDTKKLWDADEKVVESTEKAAELLEEALELSK